MVGESGELVCQKPFPSMPTHFWNDSDGALYKKAYFSKYEGNISADPVFRRCVGRLARALKSLTTEIMGLSPTVLGFQYL